jgi:hypothetical protein
MVIYLALGALIFFGFYADHMVEAWRHLTPFQLAGAIVILLLFWGPLLIYAAIRPLWED